MVLGLIPKSQKVILEGYNNLEPSLLFIRSLKELLLTKFYMDNIFLGLKTYKEGYKFLLEYLLPRLL
jgi:hypothetical protein